MEVIPRSPLFLISKEDIEFIRNSYEINDVNKINESIDAILEWMGKQDHLVESSKHITRDFIERLFLLARGSTENAKKKIEKVFTLRASMPEMCLHRTLGEFDGLLTCIKIVSLPKLVSKDRTRVTITKIISKNINEFSLLEFCRLSSMISDYKMYYDYNAGDRIILDLNYASILSKMNPVVMKKSDILAEAYGNRIKSIHILNAPSYMDTMISLFKATVRDKVASRLHVHNSYEELYQHIDKEVLPEDYGGDEISIAKLAEKWEEVLRSPEIAKLIADQDKLISDESKRKSTNSNQEDMGMPGSFRKLCVD